MQTIRLVIEGIGWLTVAVLLASLVSVMATARVRTYRHDDDLFLPGREPKQRTRVTPMRRRDGGAA